MDLLGSQRFFGKAFSIIGSLLFFSSHPFFSIGDLGRMEVWKNERTIFEFAALTMVTNMIFVVLYYGGNQESWMLTSWMMMAVFWGMVFPICQIHGILWLLIVGIIPLVFWFPLLNRSQQNLQWTMQKIW